MNWKTLLAIIGLLLIGFIAGYTTHRMMIGNRLKELRRKGPEHHLQMKIKEVVAPDKAQWEVIEPLIRDHTERLGMLSRDFHRNRRLVYDSLFENIKPHLNKDQVVRLDDFVHKMRERKRRMKGKNKKRQSKEGKQEQREEMTNPGY